jgi:hypothetical protein
MVGTGKTARRIDRWRAAFAFMHSLPSRSALPGYPRLRYDIRRLAALAEGQIRGMAYDFRHIAAHRLGWCSK